MLFDLPTELLLDVLCRCNLKDVLSFEGTCTASKTIVGSRCLWLTLLRNLDQARAPNLPPYMSVEDLPFASLRRIVVQAVQAYQNIKSGRLSSRTRDVFVELHDIPADDGLVTSGGPDFSPFTNKDNVTLVPGGEYLLVQWSHGYIQLVDIKVQKAVWTYPLPLRSVERPDDYMLVTSYAVDTREDGLVTLLLQFRRPREILLSMLEVFRIDTTTTPRCPKVDRLAVVDFRSVRDKHLYVLSASVQGDYIALKCDGFVPSTVFLVIINYVTKQVVYTNESHFWTRFRPDATIIREHLFYLAAPSSSDGPSILLKVVDLRRLFAQLRSYRHEASSYPILTLNIEELGFTDFSFDPPEGYVVSSTTLPSLCSYHWKERRDRFDQVTVMHTIVRSANTSPLVILNRYAFTPQTGMDAPNLKLISSSDPTKPIFLDGAKHMSCREETLSLSGTGIFYYGNTWNGWSRIDGRVMISMNTDNDIEENRQEGGPELHFSADEAVQWKYLASQADIKLGYEQSGAGEDDYSQCILDYWSGALLVKRTGERWIMIKYPA